jgi:hypothetical protein
MLESPPVMDEQPTGGALIFLIPLFFTIVLAAGVWLIGGEAANASAVVILTILTVSSVFVFHQAAKSDIEGAFLFQVLILAWLTKLGFLVFRWYLLFNVYHGADTLGYDIAGQEIAATLAAGGSADFSHVIGTHFIQLVAGFLYFITGPTLMGAWILFSWLGLIGMLFHYKALVTVFPNAHRRLFMLLVFFLPSILMWTGSLGKDAIMALGIGMLAYGAARVFRDGLRPGPILWAVTGVAGTLLVRPHIAAMLCVSLAALVLLRPMHAGIFTPFLRLGGFAIFIVLSVLVIRTAASFVNLEDLSFEGVTGFLGQEQQGSEQGGSAFGGGGFPTTPQALGLAIVTVLFRPFPWEAHSGLGLIAALEGVILFGLIFRRFRGVRGALWDARRHAYLGFTVIYASLFVFFFSIVSNFGILVRQRVQLLPFVFVWLAYQGVPSGDEQPAVEPDGPLTWAGAPERWGSHSTSPAGM